MHGRSRGSGGCNTGADLNRLHRLQRHDGSGKQSVQALVPLRVSAQAGGNSAGNHLEDSTQRIAGLEDFVDFVFHALLSFFLGTIQQDFFPTVKTLDLFPRNFLLHGHVANGDDVAEYVNAEFAQEGFGQGADGDACRRFAG